MKTRLFYFFAVIGLLTIKIGFSQPQSNLTKGEIISPTNHPQGVMNPNGDSYVTSSGLPFPNQNGYYVDGFEVKMFGIPKLGGDAEGDNIGDPCGITDLIPDEKGYSVYARRFNDAQNNIMFRFRVGNNNPSVEAWTILLDVDGKFGNTGANADPNYTSQNPGFELDITLIKRNNAGVLVYNIDGTDQCGNNPLVKYPISGNNNYFQISVADITTCGDLDYFYDYYVPFTQIASLFNTSNNNKYNLTGATPLRYAAVTNTSATCAMDGKIADVSGIDDTQYPSIPLAFEEIINSQCGTPVFDLEQDGGFNTELPYTPKIDETTVFIGSTLLKGTVRNSVTNAIPVETLFVRVQVFASGSTTPKFEQAIPVINGAWSVSLIPSLTGGLQPLDKIKVRVQTNAEGTGCGTGAGSEAEAETDVPPDGVDDTLETNEDTPKDGNVSTNDKPLALITTNGTYSLVTPPAHGSLQFRTDGTFTYTPNADYYGPDEFIYKLCVTSGATAACDNSTKVLISVLPVQDSPVANDDNGGNLMEDGANGTVNILLNDLDPDILPDGKITAPVNGAGQYTLDLDPSTGGIQSTYTNAAGVWTLNTATGVVTFDPANNYFGSASITYSLCDPQGSCDNAIITFLVSAVINDAPVANDDSGTSLLEDGVNGTVNILTNDTDPDGNPSAPINGTNQFTVDMDLVTPGIQTTFTNTTGVWILNAATGIVTFNPADNYYGTAVITYRLTDPQGLFDDATITFVVSPVQNPPVANDDNGGNLIEDGANGTINILLNDVDPDILPDGKVTAPVNAVGQYTVDLDPSTGGIQSAFTNATGVWTLDAATGIVTFDPANNYFGTATITYTLCDPQGACDNATIEFTVSPVNDAPVANDDAGPALIEDGASGSVNILTNDTDPDGNPVPPINGVNQFSVDLDLASPGTQTTLTNSTGVWTLNVSNGVVTFDPANNYNGTAVITYRLTDPQNLFDDATITFVVTSVSDNPVAVNDSQSTNEDTPVTFSITANDSDPDGTINAATVDLDPSDPDEDKTFTVTGQGTYTVNASGNLTFTPVLNYFGVATPINYTVKDNEGNLSNVAQIQITVNLVNNDDAPNAVDDVGAALVEDGANGTVNIIANDTDPDGNPVPPVNGVNQFSVDLDLATPGTQTTFTNATGVWTLNASNGVVTFDPANNYNGTAVITYRLTDPQSLFDDATITFVVTPVSDNPIAVNDSQSTNEDTPVTFSITANDSDPDGTINAATVDLDPADADEDKTFTVTGQGTYTVNASGNLTFTPILNYFGVATPINYTVKDNEGNLSNVAQIQITVNLVNNDDAPNAVDDVGAALVEDGANGTVNIIANDTDPDGNPVPPVNGVNQFSVDLDLATPGTQTTFTNATGVWTLNASNGVVTFDPANNYNGTAVITYRLTDPQSLFDDATITFVVTPVSDNPIAVNDSQSTNQGTPVTFSITANDSDPDGTINTASVDLDPADPDEDKTFTVPGQGTYTVNAAGNLTFTPVLTFNGNSTPVSYTVKDNEGNLSNVAQILINVIAVNTAPVAVNDLKVTDEDVSVTFSITANDTDADGIINPASVDLDPSDADEDKTYTIPGQGTFTMDNAGNVTFVPVPNYNGTTTAITYTVKDNSGTLSNQATLQVQVNPINDTPVALNQTILFNLDQTISFALTGIDVDNNPLTYTLVSVSLPHTFPGEGVLTANPSLPDLQFDPDPAFMGSVTFTFKVNDGSVDSNIATITLLYNNMGGPFNPVAQDDLTITTNEDVSVTFNVILNDTDQDGSINSATVDLDPSDADEDKTFTVVGKGIFTVDNAGNVTFVPALNYNGTTTITYTVKDNSGLLSNQATIQVIVLPVADAPIAVDDSNTTNQATAVTFSITSNDYDPDQTGSINPATVDLDPSDPDEDKTFTVPGQGTYVVAASGNLTFTPVASYFGTATAISYTVKDNDADLSNVAQIQITVNSVNNLPVASNDDLIVTNEDQSVTFSVTANDSDTDGVINPATVDLNPSTPAEDKTITIPGEGTFTVDNAGNVTFVPVPNYNGDTTPITYTVKDNNGGLSNPATIKVKVLAVADNPIAVNDSRTTNEDTPVTFSITANDTDIDGTINATTVDLDPSDADEDKTLTTTGQGVYTVNGTGNLTFTPVSNYFGVATPIQYTVKDNEGNLSNVAQIQITVLQLLNDDAPVAVNDVGLTLVEDGANGTVNIITNDTDPDGNPVAPVNGIGQFVVDLDPVTAGVQTTFNFNGVWTLNTSLGVVTYDPANNYNGTSVITYRLTDPTGLSDDATITFEVTPVSDNPIAVNDARTTNEDTPVTFSITANDTDVDGTINTATVDLDPSDADEDKTFTTPGQGVYTVNATGNLTFTPVSDYFGVATPIQYTVKDNEGNLSNVAQIQITVQQLLNDDAPVAVDDIGLTLVEDGANGTVNIITNDTDPDGNPVAPLNGVGQFVVDLDPVTAGVQTTFNANGAWTLSTSLGVVTYDPADNYTGTSVITYRLTDPTGLSDDATITFEVTPAPDSPVAVNDAQTTNEEQSITFSVIANDYDVDGPGTINAASVDLDPSVSMTGEQKTITISGEGTYLVDASGNLTFTPVTDYYGAATPIKYTIKDITGNLSNEAQIQITVLPVNDLPAAADDIYTADEDVTTTFTTLITANDTDIDGNVNPTTIDLNPTTPLVEDKTFTVAGEGTYSVDNTGKLTFTSALNYNGTTTPITYTVKDNSGGLSNTATIQILVNPVNDPPVADNTTVNVDEDNSITVCVTYTDVEGDLAVLSGAISLLGKGTVALDPNTGELCFTYTPDTDFNGTDQVEVVLCDKNNPGLCSVGVITIIVDPVNDPPRIIINNQPVVPPFLSFTTPEDVPLNFCFDADDLENDNISVGTIVNVSGGGTLVPGTGGGVNNFCFLFTPDTQFNGKSIWTVKICDDGTPSLCKEITIEIEVTPVQDAPVATDQSVSVVEDTPKVITLEATDTEGDALTYSIVEGPKHGTLSCTNCLNPVYTPDENYNGPDSFTFTSNDGTVDSKAKGIVTITITPVNDPPVVSAIPVLTTPEDNPLAICFGITDLDGDSYTFQNPVMVAGGGTMTQSGSSDFCFTFNPAENFFGMAEWTFTICDDGNPSMCTTVTVKINVTPVNDAPVAEDLMVEVVEDTPKELGLVATDVEGEVLTYSIVVAPAHGTLSCSNCANPVYTPNANYFGPDSFTFKVNDGTDDSNIATVSITVIPVNDPPVSVFNGIQGGIITLTTLEDTPLSTCFEIYDEEGNTISTSAFTQVSGGGKMVLAPGGVNQFCIEFTPAADFNGTAKWEVSICDNGSPSACGKVIIEVVVTPVNDAPVAVNDLIEVQSYVKSEPVNILLNDTDIENDKLVLTTTPVVGPLHGTVSLTADGLFQYQSILGYMGSDSVRYQVCDTGTPSLCDVAVVFIEVGPAPFKIYNGLSPNGDGLNDYWRIDGIEQYPNNTIMIFDRFNNLIFETTGYSNERNNWQGQTNHSMVKGNVSEGTYFYSVNLGDGSDLLSGYVVLKKN